jgi:hypothetical protein
VYVATAAAVPYLCEFLAPPVNWLHPKIVLVLGVLAEGRCDDAVTEHAVRTAVESELDTYLEVAKASDYSEAMELALAYLLAHFPHQRSRIEDGVDSGRWSEDDAARLCRCLTVPDVNDPTTLDQIGRAWPTPAIWRSAGPEEALHRRWKDSLRLTAVEAARIWELETRAVLAYLGAQAEHAIKEASGVA